MNVVSCKMKMLGIEDIHCSSHCRQCVRACVCVLAYDRDSERELSQSENWNNKRIE